MHVLDVLGALARQDWFQFVIQQIGLLTIAGLLLGHFTRTTQPGPGGVRSGLARVLVRVEASLPIPAGWRGQPWRLAGGGVLVGAVDGALVVLWALAGGHPLPALSLPLLALGVWGGLGAVLGASRLLPLRGGDTSSKALRGAVAGLLAAVLGAAVAAYWRALVGVAWFAWTTAQSALLGLVRFAWTTAETVLGWTSGLDPEVRGVASIAVGLVAGHLAVLVTTLAVGHRRGSTFSGAMKWGGCLLGVAAMQAGVGISDALLIVTLAGVAGAGLGAVWQVRFAAPPLSPASLIHRRGPEQAALTGWLLGAMAGLAWLAGPFVLALLVATGVVVVAGRDEAVRAMAVRVLDLVPSRPDVTIDPSPKALRRAALIQGVFYGTFSLSATFPGFILGTLADDFDVPLGAAIVAWTLGALVNPVVAVYRWVRNSTAPPRLEIALATIAHAVAIGLLVMFPSVVTLALLALVSGGITNTARLARDAVARQFPGKEGDFYGRAQSWGFTMSGVGAIAFGAVSFGFGSWEVPAAILFVWALAMGLVQTVYGRYPARTTAKRSSPGAWRVVFDREWRRLGSRTLLRAAVSSACAFGTFQVVWSRMQWELSIGLAFGAAGVLIAASLSLARFVSILPVRKYGRHADVSVKVSARWPARFAALAAACGLVLWFSVESENQWLGLAAIVGLVVLMDVGYNAASAVVSKSASQIGGTALLVVAVAQSGGMVIGGIVAAVLGRFWPAAVAVFAYLNWKMLRGLDRNPSPWQASCEDAGGGLTFEVEPLEHSDSDESARSPALYNLTVTSAGQPIKVTGSDDPDAPAFWHVWSLDGFTVRTPREPEDPYAERVRVAEVIFEPQLQPRPYTGRRSGRLRRALPLSGTSLIRVPLLCKGRQVGTLTWHTTASGEWRLDGDKLTITSVALEGRIGIVHTHDGTEKPVRVNTAALEAA